MIQLRPYQKELVENIRKSWKKGNKHVIMQLSTGGGKCLGINTPILMYDGSIKLVQDITVGDVLMGDDSTPRNVLSTCTGKETLYKVIPIKGDSFVCNESHIISLKTNNKTSIYEKGDVVDVCVKDYLNWSITQKHCAKLFRVGVEFEHHDTPIDPWLLGIWLAEGRKHNGDPTLYINSLDTEIINELSKYSTSVKDDNDRGTCKRVSLGTIGAAKNPFREEFRKCLSGKDVFICNEYKINSRTNRLRLLAGLLDGDGYSHNNHYEICTKFKTLSDDILFLARSLGMAAYMHIKYVNELPYYRITISGELSDIPHILTRKKCHKREQIKDALRTGFSLENIGLGDYYGFEIDGNSRFVLGDFTVTHNTVIFSYIAQKSAAKGSKILVLTHRDELLSQTSGTLVDFGLSPRLINSKVKHPADGLLFVGMTGTLANRLKKEEWIKWYESIDLVIIDELHEQQFNWIFDNPLTKYKFVLGVSATPKRTGNQRQLSDDYDDMVLGPDTQELINMGYLVPDRYFSSPVDLSGVHKKAGEYDTEEMYSRYNKTELYSGVIDNWKRICPDTITIVFCCNIQHSINTCKAFNEAGIKAKFLVSDVANPILEINATKADLSKYNIKKEEYENYISNFTEYSGDRKEIVAQWKRGDFKILVNAGIATTGFDFPQIETVIMNRATMSDNLLLQCLDSQTEILTNNGWRSYFNIDKNDLVCGYDMNNGYSKHVPILNIVIRHLEDDEKMFGVKNNYVDIRVTGGHRMIIANRTRAKNKNGYSDYRFCEAKNISEDVKDSFIIPVSSKNYNKDSGLSEWDLKLVGIILSDGCIRKDGVLITQSVKNKTIPEIENIINMSGVHYTKKFVKRAHPCFANGSDLYTYYINKENKIMPNKGKKGLLGIWHLLNKEIPNYYDSLSSDDFKHILYGYYIGNGSKTKNISWDRHTYTICVSNIRMANRFQQLMVTNGIKCSLAPNEDSPSKLLHYSIEKTYKSIKVKSSDSRQLWGELERKPEEIVWCIENELSTLITRRNGKVSIVGNCVGRGARISPDKEFFYLLDFGENCSRLGYYRQQREYSLTHEVGKSGQGVPASKECPKCHALVFASSHICKYCGYVFPKSREERIVELKEIKYSEAVKELKTINDYELYQKSKGYNKHWLFRQIYIKFGKDGLVEYGKAHNMSPKWAYMEMAKYRAQGL